MAALKPGAIKYTVHLVHVYFLYSLKTVIHYTATVFWLEEGIRLRGGPDVVEGLGVVVEAGLLLGLHLDDPVQEILVGHQVGLPPQGDHTWTRNVKKGGTEAGTLSRPRSKQKPRTNSSWVNIG